MESRRTLARGVRFADRWIPAHMRADVDLQRRARLLLGISMVSLPAWFVFSTGYALALPPASRAYFVVPMLVPVPFCFAVAPLLRRSGSLTLPLRLLIGSIMTMLALLCFFMGGSQSRTLFCLPILPTVSYLIGGRREGLLWWLVAVAIYIGFFAVDTSGLPVAPQLVGLPQVALAEQLTVLSITLACFALFERTKQGAIATLRDMHAALDVARAEADRASQAKTEFLSRMSHRIRTPLMAILGFSELLLADEKSGELPEPERDALRTMKRNGTHVLHIVDDMLDLSRIESDTLDLASVRLDPIELARDVIDLLRARAEGKGLQLALVIGDAIPGAIQGDPTRLRQVLLNLLGNAIKFTQQGRVDLIVRAGGAGIRFCVQDTGIGMSAEELGRVFQPFVQASRSIPRVYGGTGLGLAISRRLVEAMGGTIAVHSAPGAGTRFDLELPLGALSTPVSAVRAPEAAGSTRLDARRRILVVDDTADLRVLLHRLLLRAGADVTLACDGREAIAAVDAATAQGAPFDLILMDLQMPALDGYGATAALREQGYRGRIVALTADAMLQTRERCLAAGFDAHATKPIDLPRLLDLVRAPADETQSRPGPLDADGAAGPRAGSRWMRLVNLCVPPRLRDDPDAVDRAQMVIGVSLTPPLIVVPMTWLATRIFPPQLAHWMIAGMLICVPASAAVPVLLRATSSIGLAINAVLVFSALMIGWAMSITGGIHSYVAPWPMLLPVIALAILGGRACLAWAGLCVVLWIGLAAHEPLGIPLSNQADPRELTLAFAVACGLFVSWLMCVALLYDTATGAALGRLQQGNRELVSARDRAQRASESKGAFLSTLSHEMRTPMTAILGFADLLEESWQERGETGEACSSLRIVQRNGAHLLRLINDLLDLSKLDADRLQLERLVFLPAALLDELVRAARPQADAAGIHVHASVEQDSLGALYDDPTRIRQILEHLLDNAVQWSGATRVDARLEREGDRLAWIVEDDGRGLDEPMAERVFGERGDALEVSANTGSAGLGIALCRRLCSVLGGEIDAAPRSGGGLHVRVRLPRHALPQASPEGPSVPEPIADAPGSIAGQLLLVEDSADNQRLLSHLLRGAGARVDLACDGLEALRLVRERERTGGYDLVLMDMQMPVMDGATATRELRAFGFARPILALTAETRAEARQRCLAAGCDEVASKPIDRRALVSAVARLLSRSRAHR